MSDWQPDLQDEALTVKHAESAANVDDMWGYIVEISASARFPLLDYYKSVLALTIKSAFDSFQGERGSEMEFMHVKQAVDGKIRALLQRAKVQWEPRKWTREELRKILHRISPKPRRASPRSKGPKS